MSRPQVYSEDQIVSALKDTKGMIFLAAQKLGCNPDTIHERAKTSQPIREALHMERGKVVDTAELKLYNAVLRDEPWAIRMTLQCLGRSRGYLENGALYDLQKDLVRTPRATERVCQASRH